MKTIFISFALIISAITFPLLCKCQNDTLYVEQYCELVAAGRILSTKVNIDVNYGEERKLFKTYALKDESGKLQKFNSVVDALNFLGNAGWKLVNAFPVSSGSNDNVYHYIFKKLFLKSEVDKAERE